jgi:cyanophycin synthetase
MFEIKHETTYFGANPFSANPLVVVRIALGTAVSSVGTLRQGCLRLPDLFPGWLGAAAPCSEDPIAHAAGTAARWALAALNEGGGFLHDAGAVPIPRGADCWLGFYNQNVSLSALKLALEVLIHAGSATVFDRGRVDSALGSLWKLCHSHQPDYQARILMQGARHRDIPVLPFITGSKCWQYGWGRCSRVFFETASNADGLLSVHLQSSKILSKAVFSELGFPTPNYQLVSQIDELPKAAKVIGWPCVVKPASLGKGTGVTVGIQTMTELEAAFTLARRHTDKPIMVEAYVPGNDHRLMIVEGRLFAAIRREPTSVTGDGTNTIAQLVAAVNSKRSRNLLKSRYLRPIAVDDILEQHLTRQGVSLDTILEPCRRIELRSNANLSTGGVCIDVSDGVHPHVRQMAESVAQAMGLATAGVDYMTTDIGKSWREGGALIEINATPGADALIAAGQDPIAVASAILGDTPARIPIQLVVLLRPELARALSYLQNLPSLEGVGWACGGHAAIGGMPLHAARAGTWSTIEALLHHKSLKHACAVCSAEDIVCHGMPVDKVDHVALWCNNGHSALPAEWIKVLKDHSRVVKKFSNWIDLNAWINAALLGNL